MTALLAIALFAATSPLSSADDYVFAMPTLTNNVKGLVMGDSGDYGNVRYEDVAFLREAFAERVAIASGSINTNDLERARTNRTVRTPEIQNSILILSDDVMTSEPSDSTRIMLRAGEDDYPTNRFVYFTFSVTNKPAVAVTNYVTQVMTNGTVDVWTNVTWYAASNGLVTVATAHTNLVGITDFCARDFILRPGQSAATNEPPALPSSCNILYGHPFRRAQVTNAFAVARRVRRSVPKSASILPARGNALSSHASWNEQGDNPTTVTTNTSSLYSVLIYQTYSSGESQKRASTDDEWEVDEPPYEIEYGSNDAAVPYHLRGRIAVNVPDLLATYRAASPRIPSADVYAHVYATCTHVERASHTVEGDPAWVYNVNTNWSEHGEAMVPLGTFERSPDPTNGLITLDGEIDHEIYASIAGMTGVTFYDADSRPSLPPAGAAQMHTSEDGLSRFKGVSISAQHSLSVFISIYAILNMSPKTTLEGWNEDD